MATKKQEVPQIQIPRMDPAVKPDQNVPIEMVSVPLSGQWIPATDPMELDKNFRTMTNMRYSEAHPEGILGMSKVHSTPRTSYPIVRNAFQFQKETPTENRLLIQSYNSSATESGIFEAPTTDIAFTETALWTDSAGASNGMFSDAPSGGMCYCNGVDTVVWSGNEGRCAAFITSSATLTSPSDAPTNPRDMTELINNSRPDLADQANINGGVDSYTVLMLQANEPDGTAGDSIIDSSSSAHIVTAQGDAQVDTSNSKFGTGSLKFDGTGDYLTVPYYELLTLDVAPGGSGWAAGDTLTGGSSGKTCKIYSVLTTKTYIVKNRNGTFTDGESISNGSEAADQGAGYPTFALSTTYSPAAFGTNPFTIDYWWWPTGTGDQGFFGQYADDSNWWLIRHTYADNKLHFQAKVGGATIADYVTPTISTLSTSAWKHIELGRSGSTIYLFVDGIAQVLTETTAIGSTSMPSLSANMTIGSVYNGTYLAAGWIDKPRVSKGICRHTASFAPPVAPYITSQNYWLIGCVRPAKGVKYYISGGAGAGLAVKEFIGSTWTSLTIAADGTSNMSTTGTVSWASTVNTSKQKYIEGYYLYWYLFSITSGNPAIYYITVDMPMQNAIDVWDGYYRSIAAAYYTKTAQTDITLNVYENNYLALDTSSYADLSSMETSYYLEIGFSQKQTGLYFIIPDDYFNSTASTSMSIYYWDGSQYLSVGVLSDGTVSGGISFYKSGVVAWSNTSVAAEVRKTISGSYPLYYYKVVFDKKFDSSVRFCYVGGIPVPNEIKGYRFSAHAADRLMLGCNSYANKNALKISAQSRPDVFNGTDSYDVVFGDDKELTGAVSIFAQYTSNIYNIVLVFKEDETWNLLWNQTSEGTTFSRLRISPNVGLIAPKTLRVASVVFDNNVNQTKVVGIWRSSDGIYISNGQAPFCVSRQIANVFDQSKTTHVNISMVANECSFIDYSKLEYHWLWASNNNTSLDKEYVLDMKKWFWFEIDRTTGKRLQCGISAKSSSLGNIAYGFIDTGYTELLESGTTFDGTAIVNTWELGCVAPSQQKSFAETSVTHANLIAVAKNTSSTVTMTHSIDESTSGTNYTLTMAASGKRIANDVIPVYSIEGVFHSFKFVTSSSVETKGIEPLQLNILCQKVRNHTR